MKVMLSLAVRLNTALLLCLSFIFSPLAFSAENLVLPSGDLVAPEINHKPITETLDTEEVKRIQATVTDNVGVKEVILFYRPLGAANFLRMHMTRDMAASDEYFAIPPNIPEPGMEYYIQATDLEGNTLLRGHSFSPLTVKVRSKDSAPVLAATAEPNAQITEEATSGISKWVWIGLGVLAVGALVAGSDSGDDEAPPPTSNTGGTIIITGPAL